MAEATDRQQGFSGVDFVMRFKDGATRGMDKVTASYKKLYEGIEKTVKGTTAYEKVSEKLQKITEKSTIKFRGLNSEFGKLGKVLNGPLGVGKLSILAAELGLLLHPLIGAPGSRRRQLLHYAWGAAKLYGAYETLEHGKNYEQEFTKATVATPIGRSGKETKEYEYGLFRVANQTHRTQQELLSLAATAASLNMPFEKGGAEFIRYGAKFSEAMGISIDAAAEFQARLVVMMGVSTTQMHAVEGQLFNLARSFNATGEQVTQVANMLLAPGGFISSLDVMGRGLGFTGDQLEKFNKRGLITGTALELMSQRLGGAAGDISGLLQEFQMGYGSEGFIKIAKMLGPQAGGFLEKIKAGKSGAQVDMILAYAKSIQTLNSQINATGQNMQGMMSITGLTTSQLDVLLKLNDAGSQRQLKAAIKALQKTKEMDDAWARLQTTVGRIQESVEDFFVSLATQIGLYLMPLFKWTGIPWLLDLIESLPIVGDLAVIAAGSIWKIVAALISMKMALSLINWAAFALGFELPEGGLGLIKIFKITAQLAWGLGKRLVWLAGDFTMIGGAIKTVWGWGGGLIKVFSDLPALFESIGLALGNMLGAAIRFTLAIPGMIATFVAWLPILLPIAVAVGAIAAGLLLLRYTFNNWSTKEHPIKRAFGELAGSITIGAAIGSFIPVVGTFIGAIVGLFVGLGEIVWDYRKEIGSWCMKWLVNPVKSYLKAVYDSLFYMPPQESMGKMILRAVVHAFLRSIHMEWALGATADRWIGTPKPASAAAKSAGAITPAPASVTTPAPASSTPPWWDPFKPAGEATPTGRQAPPQKNPITPATMWNDADERAHRYLREIRDAIHGSKADNAKRMNALHHDKTANWGDYVAFWFGEHIPFS